MTKKNKVEIPSEIISIRPEDGNYILDDKLAKAINVAMKFAQPLLLTGEPVTGKTLLAKHLAWLLHQQTKDAKEGEPKFAAAPLKFNTKTTSSARDLFYTYDAIGHFQDANIKRDASDEKKSTKDFLTLQALGKAIVLSQKQSDYGNVFKMGSDDKFESSHVVLIDEIDKAPRDFTNDLLNEIENKEFEVKELDGKKIKKGAKNNQRIVIIMTSNSEKNLPEAFLRRCVFYHIGFPQGKEMLEILYAQLPKDISQTVKDNVSKIETYFQELRKEAIRKKPATAELVAFVKLLNEDPAKMLETENGFDKQWFLDNLSLLAKTESDFKAFEKFIKGVQDSNEEQND
ncbi:MAG: MoxR family ATPase [Bacteroidota bacterium]